MPAWAAPRRHHVSMCFGPQMVGLKMRQIHALPTAGDFLAGFVPRRGAGGFLGVSWGVNGCVDSLIADRIVAHKSPPGQTQTRVPNNPPAGAQKQVHGRVLPRISVGGINGGRGTGNKRLCVSWPGRVEMSRPGVGWLVQKAGNKDGDGDGDEGRIGNCTEMGAREKEGQRRLR